MGAMAATRVAERAADRADPADAPEAGTPNADDQDESPGPPLPPGRWPDPHTIHTRWTAADLETLPDDGLRYEIIDGTLVVSPAPAKRHQRVAARLHGILSGSCLAELDVYFAPLDWKVDEHTVVEPDLLVVPARDIDEPVQTPLLVVEILSPSSRTLDRVTKFHVYAEAGVPQYWIVDPGSDTSEPSVEVYDLADGEYRLQAKAQGAQHISVTGPVTVTVIPADLIR